MSAFYSQVLYGFADEGIKPVLIGEGDEKKTLVNYEDFVSSMKTAEDALGQQILQNNAESTRLNDLIVDQEIVQLPGAATLADVIVEINKINTILANLVLNGKQ